MDDATAADNCGEVTIEVSSEPRQVTRLQLRDHAHLHGNGRRWKQRFSDADHHRSDTTAPEFTFVPADYTVECSDEMPMDDATAADNCGEVTIEVSSETTPGTRPATT